MNDEALIRSFAWFFPGRSDGLTPDDLAQEGRLALWLAERDGRMPADPLHRRRYVRVCARGAMSEANSKAWRQQPLEVGAFDDTHASSDGGPEAALQMRQLIEQLMRHAPPAVARCIELRAEGLNDEEVGAEMGFGYSRISQLRKEARRLVAALW